MARAAFFIDGFNLYHAIDDLGEPHLKWCNYWSLSESLCEDEDNLVLVVLATAYHPDFKKKVRHGRLVDALTNVGVKVIMGHYVKEPKDCRGCKRTWEQPTEKESDINLALALMDGAQQDLFDHAYLVTTDTDHAATAKLFRKRFPDKLLTTVSPPDRRHAQHLLMHCTGKKAMTRDHLAKALLPRAVLGNGRPGVLRPEEYDPPAA